MGKYNGDYTTYSPTYPTTIFPTPTLELDLDLLMGLCRCQGKSGDELRETIPHILTLLEEHYPGVTVWLDKNNNIYMVKGEAEVYPCMIAHLDTVHDRYRGFDVAVSTDGDILYAYCDSTEITNQNMPHLSQPRIKVQAGTGGDDRCGLYVGLHLLRELDVFKAIFVVEEEIGGGNGSGSCDMSFFADVSLVLQVDRQRSDDWVTRIGGTDLCSKEFREKMKGLWQYHKYVECTSGGFTDVANLRRRGLSVCSANMSAGYYSPHSDTETIHLPSLQNTLNLCYNTYLLYGGEKQEFPYVEPKSYSSTGYRTKDIFQPIANGFTTVTLDKEVEYVGCGGHIYKTKFLYQLKIDGVVVIPPTVYAKCEDAYEAYLKKKAEEKRKAEEKKSRELKEEIQQWMDTDEQGKTWSHKRNVSRKGGVWVKTLLDTTDGQLYEVAYAAKKLDIPYSEGEFQYEFGKDLAAGTRVKDIYELLQEQETERQATQDAEDAREDARQLQLQLGMGTEPYPGYYNGYGYDDHDTAYEVLDATNYEDKYQDISAVMVNKLTCPNCKSVADRWVTPAKKEGEEGHFYCSDCLMFSDETPDGDGHFGVSNLDYSRLSGANA